MRLKQTLALLWAMLTISGCRSRYIVPEQPMPPNTILLSQMMRELSAKPDFTEAVLHELDAARPSTGKRGPALLTPALLQELRQRILGKDWQGLDRFPGWTMREINPTVRIAGHLAGKDPQLEQMSAVHPGSPAQPILPEQVRTLLDLGPYALDRAQTISLDHPSELPGFTTQGIVSSITRDLTRGDGPNAFAPEHAESQRLADVLNRLSVNRLAGAQPFAATLAGHLATTPEALHAALMASGHTVTITDSRYFANFGHLHYKGQDVMMPFWINTQIEVPHTGGLFRRPRPLLVPVTHAELEWHIRGPRLNADVSHYFGVDGKAEWRTMDTLDQAWVGKRDAHTYTGAQALEVTRWMGLITLAYMHQHARRPHLPFGGYYALGVCQDPVSAVEKKLHGSSTLFPNTADSALFDDERDTEINALFAAIPKDRAGAPPSPERIFGSLPVAAGETMRFSSVMIPGLSQDLAETFTAWHKGKLRRTQGAVRRFAHTLAATLTVLLSLGLILSVILGVILGRRRSAQRYPA